VDNQTQAEGNGALAHNPKFPLQAAKRLDANGFIGKREYLRGDTVEPNVIGRAEVNGAPEGTNIVCIQLVQNLCLIAHGKGQKTFAGYSAITDLVRYCDTDQTYIGLHKSPETCWLIPE
jgi:hypothetical protein